MKKYFSSYWIRSGFFNFLQRFSLTLFGFINFVVLIRSISKTEMGIWAFFIVVTNLFETTKTNLLKNAHIKFAAGNDNSENKVAIASSSFILNATISALFIFFLFTFSGALGKWLNTGPELENMLKWFIPGMIGLIFFSHLEAVSQSHFDFKSVFVGYFSRQVLFLIIILYHQFFDIQFSLVSLALYQSSSIIFGTVMLFVFSKKHLLYQFRPSIDWIKKIVGFGGYIFGSGVISNIFTNLDQLMIARLGTSKDSVASYNAATRISALMDIPSYTAAEILLPKIAQVDIQNGSEKVKYMYERMVGVLLSLTTPIALVLILFPKFFITLIAGAQYEDAALILQLYMMAGMVKPIQNQAANIMLYIGKARLSFFLNILFLAINFAMNFILLKHFRFYGAAMGNVITCFAATAVWYFVLKSQVQIQFKNILGYVVATYKLLLSKAHWVIVSVRQYRFR